jgi:hypothetical protein
VKSGVKLLQRISGWSAGKKVERQGQLGYGWSENGISAIMSSEIKDRAGCPPYELYVRDIK